TAVHREQMRQALLYLAFAERLPQPSTQYPLSFWADRAAQWLESFGYERSMNIAAFTAAAIVSGVPYTANYPYTSFGLALGALSEPRSSWSEVLATKRLPAPTELKLV